MSLYRYFELFLKHGFFAGIAAGHLEAVHRLVAVRYEWYHLYTAILLPVLVFVPLYSALAALAEVSRRLSGSALSRLELAGRLIQQCRVMSASIFGAILLHLTLGQFFEPVAQVHWNFLALLVLFGLLLRVGAAGEHLSVLDGLGSSWLGRLVGNYSFAVLVFLGFSIASDTVQQRTVPAPTVSPQQEGIDREERPNVLLLTLDTLRADHLSAYGYRRQTPNLDRIASRGVLFENAYSSSSWTLPAHAGMFTGKYAPKHGATFAHQKLADKHETLAELLSANGYATAGFVGGGYCKRIFGVAQGFSFYDDRLDFFEMEERFAKGSIRALFPIVWRHFDRKVFGSDNERRITEINPRLLRWLRGLKGAPFFAFVNYFDAHNPYDLGAEFRAQFTSSTADIYDLNDRLMNSAWNPERMYRHTEIDPESLQYAKDLYDTEIFYLDYHLGLLFAELERQGLMDNTILVITSDHGEEFFEHGGAIHGRTLYEEVLRVPLIIFAPKLLAPRRVAHPVSTIDIFSTILELTGTPSPTGVDAESLVPLMLDDASQGTKRDRIFAHLAGRPERGEIWMRAVASKGWKLIEVEEERERVPNSLFDLRNDPHETDNRFATEPERRRSLSVLFDSSVSDLRVKETQSRRDAE